MNNLTDRNFWKEYWSNYVYEKVPVHSEFDDYLAPPPCATARARLP